MTDLMYTFCVLQYVDDAVTCEALNLGVVAYASELRQVQCRFTTDLQRVIRTFPKADKCNLSSAIKVIKMRIEICDGVDARSVLEIARSALADDESALRWAGMGAGICTSLSEEIDALFARLVPRPSSIFSDFEMMAANQSMYHPAGVKHTTPAQKIQWLQG